MTGPVVEGPVVEGPVVERPVVGGTGPVLQVRDLHVEIATRRGVVRAVDGVSVDVPRVVLL